MSLQTLSHTLRVVRCSNRATPSSGRRLSRSSTGLGLAANVVTAALLGQSGPTVSLGQDGTNAQVAEIYRLQAAFHCTASVRDYVNVTPWR